MPMPDNFFFIADYQEALRYATMIFHPERLVSTLRFFELMARLNL